MFVKNCIEEWLSRAHTCPIDRSSIELDQLKPVPRIFKNLLNRFVKIFFFVCYVNIFSLDITCENEGCTVIVKLDGLANHLAECEYGPKKFHQCENGCGMMIAKENLSVRFYLLIKI